MQHPFLSARHFQLQVSVGALEHLEVLEVLGT
jgi:hypothetical protein